ncbi:protein phosphatase Slingshot homolog 2 isoform X2 [Lepisosteus oculatus]|uniref:protein phosphatase Slingshot homolog 2 isoform X2 n=1 Tax=Lepisosteus oculatus TaxID=7918 RepID=UPI00371E1719
MTLGALPAGGSSAAGSVCACCGAKMMPYFSENAVISQNKINQLFSESFLTVKGAALFLPRGNGSPASSTPRASQRRNKHAGDLQQHLQTMFTLLRPEDNIRLAVRLESAYPQCTRYMVVVSTNGRQDTEESIVLGMDFSSRDSTCTVGLVLPLWSDTLIHLDGDGGFSVSTVNRVHVFKPVSVQAMWSALQSLHKACEVARCHNYYPGSLFLTWVSYYQSRISSDQMCVNEWNAMRDVQSHRADSPVLFTDVPTERERTERLIKTRLREIMMQKDLENVTSKEIRTELEMQMVCNLREFKEFIDNEMIVILGQMDSPTEIFDHVFLGSEWNASNLEELQNSGVRYILNVTREIDNFFPGMFEYHNIRVYDEEATDLLAYWNDTYKFISKAKKAGAKCLVHCKMGVSRSASTVIAYAMKEYGWDLERAFDYVKERRAVTKPNPSFMRQLEEYQGILLASKQRHNKLWRSHSDSDLSEHHEPLCKPQLSLGPRDTRRSSSSNNNNSTPQSLEHFLGMAVLQALTGSPAETEAEAGRDELSPSGEAPATAYQDQPTSNGLCDLSPAEDLPSPLLDPPLLPLLVGSWASALVPERATDSAPAGDHGSGPDLQPAASELPKASVGNPCSTSPVPQRKPGAPQLSIPMPHLMMTRSEVAPALPEHKAESPVLSASVPVPRPAAVEGMGVGDVGPGYPMSPGTPMAVSPLSPPGAAVPGASSAEDDINNNDTGGDTGSAGSSSLSTDSIDFFSAREKFLELSQDGRARTLSNSRPEEQAAGRTPHLKGPGQELPLSEDPSATPSAEEPPKEPPVTEPGCAVPHSQSENGVSVRHIVTELESISQASGGKGEPAAAAAAAAPPPGDPEPDPAEPGSPVPCADPAPPAGQLLEGAADPRWPCGSVRRVTKQLERRFRQEPDSPAPRRPPPAEETPPTHPALAPPPAAPPLPGPAPPCPGQGLPPGEKGAPRTEPPPAPPEPVAFLRLEGATEHSSDTDPPAALPPPCRAEHPERIRETLQAFLCEAAEGQELSTVRQRALEIEARIRRAGLTPPSLMKRSASLAKLGCLELSADDLCQWDSQTPVPTSPAGARQPEALPCPSPEDASKKQRVVLRTPEHETRPASPQSTLDFQQGGEEGLPLSTGHAPGNTPPPAPLVAMAARQQHGRTHPLRRLKNSDKRRSSSSLYNTM